MVRTANGPSIIGKALLALFALGILMMITASLALATAYSYYTQDLPSPDRLQNRQLFRSTKILDRNGRLLYELFDPQAGKRTSVKLSEISPHLVKATIAIEDATFYENQGISPRGILRAALANLRGEEIQGASTITQQLIKMVLLTPQVSIERKVQEMILAYKVNQQYTKDQVLEWYLNEIPYGNMAYGIEAATEAYFGKKAADLDLAEASMLAGIPQAPALLSPLVDPAAAKRRQKMVLDAMVKEEYVSQQEADTAFNKALSYQPMQYGIEAPHFVMYVRSLLEQKYGPRMLYSGGLTVRTTLDLDMERVAERIARKQVEKLAKDNIHNAALVAIRPSTGEILAMMGSVDYFNKNIAGQVNIATSERQPGSTFKPITYASSFTKGWSPSTIILDYATTFYDRAKRPYTPKNVDLKWHGPVSIRVALANSMNVPAVKAIEYVSVKNAIAMAHQMGITTLENEDLYDLSLTLGGGEVKLLDLVYTFSVFANGGMMHGQPVAGDKQKPGFRIMEPVAILRVEDADGKVLEEFTGPQRVEALRPQIAYLITSILTDTDARRLLFGNNDPLKLSRPAAAKTGTTENNQDLWTVGYTPDLVTGVWVGNSDNKPIAPVLSSLTAAPIWHDFMEEVHAGTPVRQFDEPAGLEKATVCAVSGLRPSKYCTNKITDVFIKGSAPTRECDIHRSVVVDKTTGHLATMLTPPENREEKVVEIYPPEWAAWAKAAGKSESPQPPPDPEQPAQPVTSQDDNSTLIVISPSTGSAIRGSVEIRGNASGKSFASYQVEFGEGLAPTSWKPIGGVHNTPVDNNVLERWDTGPLNGPVKIRVTLTHKPQPAPTPAPAPQPGPGTPGPAPTPVPAPIPAPSVPKTVELTLIVDNQPPVVAISYPEDGATVQADRSGKVAITAQVSDNHRVAKTDIYVDNRLIGSSSAVPMASTEWTPSPGSHNVFAITKDVAGNETRSKDVKITVK